MTDFIVAACIFASCFVLFSFGDYCMRRGFVTLGWSDSDSEYLPY